ncbi:hypothetical protein ACF1G0_11100 [Streptomyces sp. NPDC013953]|uniref:hypothetical protein n=1 Tax=Streptomyces sp. NPDC013953 TaxID=3364868 RepID=UPI0036FE7316
MPRALTALAAAMGFIAIGATPASAHPDWQTYKANSNWDCGPSDNLSISKSVIFQTCVVTTPSKTHGQLVVVVSNRSTKTVELKGAEFDSDIYGRWDGRSELSGGFCGFHELKAGQARGCFGNTVELPCGVGLRHSGFVFANRAGKDETPPFSSDRLAGC